VAVTPYVALLRAVNLGAHNKVAMRDLVALASALGLREPRSLLQSGNLVFRSSRRAPDQLERALQSAAAERLGLMTDVFVRDATEWRAIMAANPFTAEAKADPGHLVVMCLKTAPDRSAVASLRTAIAGREAAHLSGRQAYLVYPDGIAKSRLTTAAIEKAIGARGTARNWNTVEKIAALLDA
jgi:uncharacterized protein (DUF1697 family)